MSTGCNSQGVRHKIITQGGAAPRFFTDSSILVPFVAENIIRIQEWGGRRRDNGKLANSDEGRRLKRSFVYGTFMTECSPETLALWLPRALWNDPVGDDHTPGTASEDHRFDMLVNKERGVFHYTNCILSRLEIKSSESGLMTLTIGLFGTEEKVAITSWPSPEPAVQDGDEYIPYMLHDTTLHLDGTEIQYETFNFTIQNLLKPCGHNELSPSRFRSKGRDVRISAAAKFDETSLSQVAFSIESATQGLFVMTHPIAPMAFEATTRNLRNTGWETPTTPGKVHVPLNFTMEAAQIDDEELLITNRH